MYDVITICNIVFLTTSGSLFSFSALHSDWLRMTKSLGKHRYKSVFGLKEFCVWFGNEKSCTFYREFRSKDNQSNKIAVFFYKGKIHWLFILLRIEVLNQTFIELVIFIFGGEKLGYPPCLIISQIITFLFRGSTFIHNPGLQCHGAHLIACVGIPSMPAVQNIFRALSNVCGGAFLFENRVFSCWLFSQKCIILDICQGPKDAPLIVRRSFKPLWYKTKLVMLQKQIIVMQFFCHSNASNANKKKTFSIVILIYTSAIITVSTPHTTIVIWLVQVIFSFLSIKIYFYQT